MKKRLLLFIVILAAPAAFAAEATVTAFRVTPGENAARVEWQATADGIDGWAIEWRSPARFFGPVTQGVNANERSYTITGLRPGRVYTVRIYPYVRQDRTIRNVRLTGDRPTAEFRVGRPATGKPATPRGLRAVADADRVLVSWAPNPERHVAGYEIGRMGPDDEEFQPYARLNIAAPRPSIELVEGGSLEATGVAELVDPNVEEGAEYRYSVRAFTEGDPPEHQSDPSPPVAVTAEPYRFRPPDLLIVSNVRAPNAERIANNYARARQLRNVQRLRVDLPVGAEISREDFNRRLLAPVREHVAGHPRTTIILLVRGIPWRIRQSDLSGPRRYQDWCRASVDSELTLARVDEPPVQGRIRNPLHARAEPLSPVHQLIAVCRLDGPDDQTANELVSRAIQAQRQGVEGIAFFDARGIQSGAYAMGDRTILRAAELMKESERMPVRIDEAPAVVDLSTVDEKIGFYYGWYSSRFEPANENFRFGRGAIGGHIHSYAGHSISRDRGWVGQMLWHGATAAVGVADEPLLDGFPTADALVDALLRGRNFAEASLAASRYVSWMPIYVGDPLYRPFPAED